MAWISVKEYASLQGISERAVQKAIAKGKHQVKDVPHPSRKDQVAFLIWTGELANQSGEPSGELANQSGELANQSGELANQSGELANQSGELANQTGELANQSGEPCEPDHFADDSKTIEPAIKQSFTTETEDSTLKQCLTVQPTIREDRTVQAAEPLSLVALSDKAEFESFPRERRELAYARLEIVKAWIDEKQRAKVSGIKIGELEKSFIKHLLQGSICLDATECLKRSGEIKLSIRTIYRWEKAIKSSDSLYPIALIDKWSVSKISKDQQYVRAWVKMQASDPRGRSVMDIMRNAQHEVPGFDLGYRTVARIVEEARRDKFLSAALTGPTAWKNEARPHNRRINDCGFGDRYEADGKVMNVLVMSPFWFHNDKSLRYLLRPVIVVWMDVASWMITGWATWQSESWHLVRTSFVDAISNVGVPKTVVYDGGGSFQNVYTDPHGFASRKRETASVKKARQMIAKGYNGFYEKFGVEKRVKTIPGNSESKQIEPAWGAIFADWEKRQFAYVGKDFENRPEWLRMTNVKLMKTYKDQIMTWDEYTESIGAYINEWNNRPRASLVRADGSIASPIEMYREFQDSMKRPSKELVEHMCWHPKQAIVQRDGIYLDGLIYRHPAFSLYQGHSMLVEYDERNRFEATIATMSGEKLATPARLLIPGTHMDDEQSKLAYKERGHYEKELKAVYLARVNHGESITMSELNSITARIEHTFQDQSRAQEKIKEIQLTEYKPKQIKSPTKQREDVALESIESELELCTPLPVIPDEEEDEILKEIDKELANIGLRSIR